MILPKIVSRDEWLAARKELLAREKEFTRTRDALNADRRRLPMVKISKDYVFEGPGGKASLSDPFSASRASPSRSAAGRSFAEVPVRATSR